MKKIFIITGELSGDKHAADVVRALKKLRADIQIEAVGGENLAAEGVKLYTDHSKMSAVGFSFKILYNHIMLGKRLCKYLRDEYKPDIVLMVDYGGFNLNLSKVLSKYGFKLYYYIPPQIWASRKWRLNTVKKCINKVITIFPFEKEMYEKAGVDVEYVGHPLLAQLPAKTERNNFFDENNFDKKKKLISIFPGSRVFEINNLLELFLESARLIKEQNKDVQYALAQAPGIKDDLIYPIIDKYKDLNIKVLKKSNYELLSVSDALILASGTVALEAALYGTPMIISYKGPAFLYIIYTLVRCIKRVCLPNIIMDKDIVPELIQKDANKLKISECILKILNDENYKNKMIESLAEVREKLMITNAAQRTAEIISDAIL